MNTPRPCPEVTSAELIAPPVRDSLGRARSSGRDRERWLDAFERSGLAQAKFCRREGLDPTTFSGWVCKRRGQRERGLTGLTDPKGLVRAPASDPSGLSDAAAPAFRELSVCAPPPSSAGETSRAPALTVVLPGGVEVRGCDARSAAELIRLFKEGR